MADWVHRQFRAVGLTQVPPGPHLATVQANYGGAAIFCFDVSGSMAGSPVKEVVRGARQFVAEGLDAAYEVGVILWNTICWIGDALARSIAVPGSA